MIEHDPVAPHSFASRASETPSAGCTSEAVAGAGALRLNAAHRAAAHKGSAHPAQLYISWLQLQNTRWVLTHVQVARDE